MLKFKQLENVFYDNRGQARTDIEKPMWRSEIPGGWLMATVKGVTFIPDPNHVWDGSSIE